MKLFKYLLFLLIFLSCQKSDVYAPIDREEENIVEKAVPIQNLVWLDFDGDTTLGSFGYVQATPPELSNEDIGVIVDSVKKYFSMLNISFTLKKEDYMNANRRIHVVITDNWEWDGHKGGDSFIGAFQHDSSSAISYVFPIMLHHLLQPTAVAIAHEIGHDLGLQHQSLYNSDGEKINEYNPGDGVDGPIMGNGYNKTAIWTTGPSTKGVDSIQNDIAIMQSTLSK